MGDRGHNRHGPKIGGTLPLLGGAGFHLTQSRLFCPKPTSVPSGILIHPVIWPQPTWAENWGWLPPPLFWGGAG